MAIFMLKRSTTNGPAAAVEYPLPSRSCLFLGCSLKQDRTMAMLKTIAAQYKTMHFAVVEVPGEKGRVRATAEKELSDLGICPIWYPFGERHASIEPLLEYLAMKSVSGVLKGYITSFRAKSPRTTYPGRRTRWSAGRKKSLSSRPCSAERDW